MALTSGKGGTMGLEGLKTAVRIGRVRGEAAKEQALKQVLQRYAGGASDVDVGADEVSLSAIWPIMPLIKPAW